VLNYQLNRFDFAVFLFKNNIPASNYFPHFLSLFKSDEIQSWGGATCPCPLAAGEERFNRRHWLDTNIFAPGALIGQGQAAAPTYFLMYHCIYIENCFSFVV